jgi:hypothetical protein
MPLSGFKSVTVSKEAYDQVKELICLGLEENIGKAFYNAINEYVKKREPLIKELKSVREKWSKEGM